MAGLSDWTPTALAQLEGGALRPGFLFRMALNDGQSPQEVIRLWSGYGDHPHAESDAVETANAIYRGIGELVDIPTFNQLINGVAERVDFTLAGAGISSDIAALASTEADDVVGADIRIGFFVMDAQYAVVSPTAWLGHFRADSLAVQREDGGDGAVRSITVSAASIFARRMRPQISFFTPRDQKQRSADDTGCDNVPRYNAGTTILWPM